MLPIYPNVNLGKRALRPFRHAETKTLQCKETILKSSDDIARSSPFASVTDLPSNLASSQSSQIIAVSAKGQALSSSQFQAAQNRQENLSVLANTFLWPFRNCGVNALLRVVC
eukprot:scpid80974/ scgid15209/ 